MIDNFKRGDTVKVKNSCKDYNIFFIKYYKEDFFASSPALSLCFSEKEVREGDYFGYRGLCFKNIELKSCKTLLTERV